MVFFFVMVGFLCLVARRAQIVFFKTAPAGWVFTFMATGKALIAYGFVTGRAFGQAGGANLSFAIGAAAGAVLAT